MASIGCMTSPRRERRARGCRRPARGARRASRWRPGGGRADRPRSRRRRSSSDRRDRPRPRASPPSIWVSAASTRSGPSSQRDRPKSGSGATRLDQTMKPSMSTRPARLDTMLATPQAAAATTVMRKGTGAAAGQARPGDEDEAEAGDDAADDLVRPGPLAHQEGGEEDREEDLRLHDQGGEARRHAEGDGGEEEPELGDAEEEAVGRRRSASGLSGAARRGSPGGPRRGSEGRRAAGAAWCRPRA